MLMSRASLGWNRTGQILQAFLLRNGVDAFSRDAKLIFFH